MHTAVAQNVPLLTQKSETRFTLASGTESFGFQGAWAFSKSFALIGSYSTGLNELISWIPDVKVDNGSRWSGELAAGYYKLIGDKGVFEIYAGAERYYRNYSVTPYYGPHLIFATNYTLPFVQMDLGFQNIRKHSFAFSFKLGYMTYDHSTTLISDQIQQDPNKLVSEPGYFGLIPGTVIEPCITYHVGNENVSFQAQIGFAFTNLGAYSIYGGSYLDPFFLNVGLSLRLFAHKEEKK
jgi:hypothetical protein